MKIILYLRNSTGASEGMRLFADWQTQNSSKRWLIRCSQRSLTRIPGHAVKSQTVHGGEVFPQFLHIKIFAHGNSNFFPGGSGKFQLYVHFVGPQLPFPSSAAAAPTHPTILRIAVTKLHPLLHFLRLLRGSAIGSTPAFGAGYPGSSPGPGANLFISGLQVQPAPDEAGSTLHLGPFA